jgi:hypothetical protein
MNLVAFSMGILMKESFLRICLGWRGDGIM